jgi:response regulator RpfG family c-di-GMP phosphodiesterase
MSIQAKPKVLLVDDEVKVVESLALLLRREFDVRVASSPQEALKQLSEIHDLAVVVSDMRMPGMDGATLLHEILLRRPDVARILLTGEAGRDAAIRAVNEGQILRFLTKPCPTDDLKRAIDAGVIQHRLIHAERTMLQETLIGCINALMEVLALANPVAFGRAQRIKRMAMLCAARFNCTDFWQLEAAAMLSQLGYITVPEVVLEKMHAGQPLTDPEKQKVGAVPDVSNSLLEHIPRLEPVIQILAALKYTDAQIAKLGDGTIGLGTRILGAVIEYEGQVAAGKSSDQIFAHLHQMSSRFGEKLVMHLMDAIGTEKRGTISRTPQEREMLLRDVTPGMRLQTELRSMSGALLVPMNFEVSKTLLDRLSNIAPELMGKPVRISMAQPGS